MSITTKQTKTLPYPQIVKKLFKIKKDDNAWNQMHATLGMVTEIGELLDCLKKHIIYGQSLDINNLKEELGDFYFYFTAYLQVTELKIEVLEDGSVYHEKTGVKLSRGYLSDLINPKIPIYYNILYLILDLNKNVGNLFKENNFYQWEDILNIVKLYLLFLEMINLLNLTEKQIQSINVNKLSIRYPNLQYSDQSAKERKDKINF